MRERNESLAKALFGNNQRAIVIAIGMAWHARDSVRSGNHVHRAGVECFGATSELLARTALAAALGYLAYQWVLVGAQYLRVLLP